jgi:phosphoglucomutase
VLAQSLCPDAVSAVADDFKIIYTPFHGAGYKLVPEALRRSGFKHIIPVPEQMVIDGSFPTVKSPNPEEKEGFTIAIGMAKKLGVDLIIGTDPDSDRAGIVVRGPGGEYVSLTGNQVGAMLTDFIISTRREKGMLPDNAAVVTTIVSTRMAGGICKANGVDEYETLTGFKFIGEKIKEFEESGSNTFIFGFEESYGYLCGSYTRDKDAVLASMLIAQMAAWYKLKNMTLYDALMKLYEKYGYYAEKTTSIRVEGGDALLKMGKTMKRLRAESPTELAGTKIIAVRDYLSGERRTLPGGVTEPTGLPKSDVLVYELADGCTAIIRPSGTEPKIKLYLLVKAEGRDAGDALISRYETAARALLA